MIAKNKMRNGAGTHWTCYFKRRNRINYYDGFGNLPPPIEFIF